MSNRTLLILFLSLLSIWVGSIWIYDRDVPSPTYAIPYWTPQNLQKIVFRSSSDSLYLSQKEQRWYVNNTYYVNESLLSQLFSVLESMEERRTAKTNEYDTALEIQRREIQIVWKDLSSVSFEVIGLPLSQKSYIHRAEESAELYIQGYVGYVAGMFFLSSQQWRHRQVMSTSSRTFRKLRVCYSASSDDDFVILRTPDDRFRIPSLPTADTMRIHTYLSQYSSFYVNEYITQGQVPYYDSLMQTTPLASVFLHDKVLKNMQHLTIYYQNADPYFLLKDKEGSYALCERKRLLPLIRKKAFFTKRSL